MALFALLQRLGGNECSCECL